ncbi:MAG: hemerythrin domain-containing protein [Myxococcota bacterium]
MEPWTILGSLVLGYVAVTGARPTDPFREQHAELRTHLAHLSTRLGALASVPAAEQRALMLEIVAFLDSHVRPHAQWEERVLYALVDRKAGGGTGITATMRHEHRIVDRWIDELAAEAARPQPDPRAFGRRAHNLLGLLQAHFEEEEEVLLPVLDRTMSRDEFMQAMGPSHP